MLDLNIEYVLGIDPGPEKSGYVILRYNIKNKTFIITEKVILKNEELFKKIFLFRFATNPTIVIEQLTSFGMAIGQTTMDSIFWTGRFYQKSIQCKIEVILISRKEIKLSLCGNYRAKDKNIRQRLIDKFGLPGTKKQPGKLYGISNHLWSSLAAAVVFLEKKYGELSDE